MPRYKVQFKHTEKSTYEGYVEADSEDEALATAEAEPFEMDELEQFDVQGIDCEDFEIIEENE